jgi:hypothetical protein
LQYKIAFPTETAARISFHTMRILASRIYKMRKRGIKLKVTAVHDMVKGFPVWVPKAKKTRTSDCKTSLISLRKMQMKLTSKR